MKRYRLRFEDRAKVDMEKYKKSGEKAALKKLEKLLYELEEHPKTGTGKPEPLKGLPNHWSRRISDKHRLVYEIQEDVVIVLVLSAYGHYDDE